MVDIECRASMSARLLTRRSVLLSSSAFGLASVARGQRTTDPISERKVTSALSAPGSPFIVGCDGGAITSLNRRNDAHYTDYVRSGGRLGVAHARVRRGSGEWAALSTSGGVPRRNGTSAVVTEHRAAEVTLASALELDGDTLRWRVTVRNDGATPVEVGDLFLPMPMDGHFAARRPVSQVSLKHSFVSGHGSHVIWIRGNSAPPFLMLLPEHDTHLEYWDVQREPGAPRGTWCAYVHAAAASADTASRGTKWRQPVSALTLAPGVERHYTFRFLWVDGYDEARAAIANAGLVDVEVVPGMTVPSDLHADMAFASSAPVERIEAEFPDTTEISPLPPHAGRQLWRVRFARLGENRLTLHQPGGRRTYLEFFATEPVETMMKKRAGFIVRRQHRDPAKWYDGLFAEWNMETATLLGPDNYDRIKGWRIYEVTCDDPGLSKPAYLAAKNAEHPVAAEVAALDHYIDKFVWGGLQQTTKEQYPYGIYGIPDWKQNRESPDPGTKGRLHIWRPYDYPHIFLMYLSMHRIARDHPAVPTRLSARDYLMRAYGTALAMFTVPVRVTGWSAYRTGFYNECVIPELVATLRTSGMSREAATLESHWARKVRTFLDPEADLFGSEYPFDSTGFESTQALARSALDTPEAMGVTPAAAKAFSARQLAGNIFCRGWLEPSYYYLGSDYRGSAGDAFTLTYMSQMGGWALLDHALHDAEDPYPLLRLGYASQLSAWALLNSGPASSNHGYWYPGESNDGAAGGGFEPAPEGETWLDQPHHRGSWYYSCETDLGYCGALRAAAAIVVDDPVFGRVCYGGTIENKARTIRVVPRDGVRRRMNVRLEGRAFDLTLHDARFERDKPIEIRSDGSCSFSPEPFANGATKVRLTMRDAQGRQQDLWLSINDGRVVVRTT